MQCGWVGAVRGLSPRSPVLQAAVSRRVLGSLFLHLPPLLLPTGPHCLALAGLQDLSTPICPWLLLLTFCHSVSSPLDSLRFSTTHTLKEAVG